MNIFPHMLAKSGLGAQILTSGTIKGGDTIIGDNRRHTDLSKADSISLHYL